jgi:WD40 repeat protein
MARRYASGGRLAPNHLEHLAQAASYNLHAATTAAQQNSTPNLLLLASTPGERLVPAPQNERGAASGEDNNTNSGSSKSNNSGRTIQEAIVLDNNIYTKNEVDGDNDSDNGDGSNLSAIVSGTANIGGSAMYKPTLISTAGCGRGGGGGYGSGGSGGGITNKLSNTIDGGRTADPSPKLHIQPTRWEAAHRMAETMRAFLDLRETARSLDDETTAIEASLSTRRAELSKLIENGGCSAPNDHDDVDIINDQVASKKRECDRVVSQLERKLDELMISRDATRQKLSRLQCQVRSLNDCCRSISEDFYDPFEGWKGTVASGSRIGGNVTLNILMARERGLAATHRRGNNVPRRPFSMIRGSSHTKPATTTRKNIFETRFDHAVTIHAHSRLPVFCLRFDRTGRYFISGADDFLVKVFYIGADKSSQKRALRNGSKVPQCNYGANTRGAVLVCTLRGHNNVINDIHVSPDNSLLATSSDDGDVRIWSLKNGCPVAILRGHVDGANGVSWSPLTPYRLLTNGSDGMTRLWDIRDACLKRCSSDLGKRADYKLQLTDEEEIIVKNYQRNICNTDKKDGVGTALPPLPLPLAAGSTSMEASSGIVEVVPPPPLPQAAQDTSGSANQNGIIVPPLPAAVPPLGQGAHSNVVGGNGGGAGGNGRGRSRGEFVANDLVDEGVKLLSKYQHGSTQGEREQQPGPGTRSRRAPAKVVCISYCPLGRQFVTGTDDGICRVWESYDDAKLEIIDGRHSRNESTWTRFLRENGSVVLKSMQREPLLKLMGHLSAVTDLSYSNAGDRILSASEKDGVVRLWNVGVAPLTGASTYFKELRVTQIVIKLINPSTDDSNDLSQRGRRRPVGSSKSNALKVSCNCAVWTHDDSKVITSQALLKKEASNDIQPGSQYLFLWDSKTGICLMGIAGAHQMACNIVIPHPYDSSIVCSGGGEGKVHVWDWETGKCIFTHENKAMYPGDRTGNGGYLDGSFSPDGSKLVLGDDAGQVSVFDVIAKQNYSLNAAPAWMQEQYFADDYYEVEYDENGHCYDKRSGRPPHLAPKSARCSFGGSAYSEEINDTFRALVGPSPLPEDICRWNRDSIRKNRPSYSEVGRFFAFNAKVRVGVREFDSRTTLLIHGEGFVEEAGSKTRKAQLPNTESSTGQSQDNRRMSENYRYLDYDDLVRREGEDDEQESEDEDFEPAVPRGRATRTGLHEDDNDDSNLEDDGDDDAFMDSTENRSRRRNRNQQVSMQRRERAERRARRNPGDFMEIDSDDELVQYCSANTSPNGAYVRDITTNGHFWRMRKAGKCFFRLAVYQISRSSHLLVTLTSYVHVLSLLWSLDVNKIHRKWLHRSESDTSYNGKKIYAPQVGDSVVYIPRAHLETIDEFPSFIPPWQNWPQEAEWPVVRCFVRGCRYRFPFADYFRAGQVSIVAILTLEVTGIPELSADRRFPWPKPSFVEPANPYVFELSLFENSNCDYLIPEVLYTSRLKALEANLLARNGDPRGLQVDMFFENNGSREDPSMEVWLATIDSIEDDDDRNDIHLRGSGYGAVQVSGDDYSDTANPWELNTDGMDLTRPTMSQDDKKSVLDALTKICRNDLVAEQLTRPVNSQQYYDYDTMVEVPMDIMFIKRRVNSNYYNSKLAVVADLRLVRDNCIKYNTAENDISEVAIQMCIDFEREVLTVDDLSHLISEEEFDIICQEQANGNRQRTSLRIRIPLHRPSVSSNSSVGRYTLRDRSTSSGRSSRGSSSLEQLPSRQAESPPANRNRRNAGSTRRLRRTGTDVLNMLSAAAGNRPGRSSRSANPIYREVDNSEGDSFQLSENNAARRRPRRGNGTRDEMPESPRRRSSRLHALDEEDEMEGESEDNNAEEDGAPEPERAAPSRSLRSKRSSRLSYDDHKNENSDEVQSSDGESEADASFEEEEVESSTRRCRAGRSRASAQTWSTIANAGRRPRRVAAGKTRTSYEEIDSDTDEAVDESEEEEEVPPSRSPRRPIRRTRRGKASTESSGSSDESEEAVDGSEDELSDYETTTRRSQNKRKRNTAPTKKNVSKKKRSTLPDISEWPEIGVEKITVVTKAVLSRINTLDTMNAFSAPVLEFFPEIEEEYLSVVEEPMDLRTIEEERIHTYASIRSLQHDLILMFRNCCAFNAEGEDIWEHAASLWGQVNTVFVKCCEELGVLLPRRWTP